MLTSSRSWSSVFDLSAKKEKLKELEQQVQDPNFWKQERPAEVQQEYASLKEQIEKIVFFKKEFQDLQELLQISSTSEEDARDIEAKIQEITNSIDFEIRKALFSGKYDKNSAILLIESGAGGRDAEDWSCLILKMYQRYCEKKQFKTKILSQSFGEGGGPEGRIGIKQVSMAINGKFAYGFLKNETGVHRLVRISPFSTKKLRHTSFSIVEVLPDLEDSDADIIIKPEDLKIETFRASGPGGQYVNKRESAVRIRHLPSGIVVSSQTERLQGQNKKTAMNTLVSKLALLKEQEQKQKIQDIKGKRVSADFGRQTRSYVLHPYKLVKDLVSGIQTNDVESVLDGNLDLFIDTYRISDNY